jgi:hypothetical protein
MANRLTWSARVGCEGGPLLVAGARDFARWPGSLGTSRPKTILWYYGHAVAELPDRFRPDPDSGHQWLHHDTTEAARQTMAELRDAMVAKFPGTKVTEDDLEMHILLPDRRALEVQVGPRSEYDASWQSHQEEETWTHVWGKESDFQAFFWELEGGCVVDVGLSGEKDELVLIQSWVDDKADLALVRDFVAGPREDEEDSGGELVVPTGHAVIVWSPTSVVQLVDFDFDTLGFEGFEKKLREMAEQPTPPRFATDMIVGLGTAMMIEPGRWRARVGAHEHDGEEEGGKSWSARWCRLTWTAG